MFTATIASFVMIEESGGEMKQIQERFDRIERKWTRLPTWWTRMRNYAADRISRRRSRAIVYAVAVILAGCGSSSSSPTMPTTPPVAGLVCGEERWAVKTLSDPDVSRINLAQIVPTTISVLNALPPHCISLPENRMFAEEFQVFEVTGRVTIVRMEEDRDYHVVLADLSSPADTMITESPDPQCEGVVSSPQLSLLQNARQSLLAISGGRPASLMGQSVRVQGVGFYDFDHGQTGKSRSCIELHPITRVERVN